MTNPSINELLPTTIPKIEAPTPPSPFVSKIETPPPPPIPKVETPVPKVETPVPKIETPAPKVETPKPKVETPVTKVKPPSPMIKPVIEQPAVTEPSDDTKTTVTRVVVNRNVVVAESANTSSRKVVQGISNRVVVSSVKKPSTNDSDSDLDDLIEAENHTNQSK